MALFLAVLEACDPGGVAEPEAALEVVPDSVTLTHLGQRFAFSVRGGGADAAQLQWVSRDTTVFVVDANGSVTARGNGAAQVVARTPMSADGALVRVRQAAAALEVTGDGQRAAVGFALLDPVGVRVLDAGGSPASGIAVRFEAGADNGRIRPAAVHSDGEGMATAEWTLGPEPGRQTLTVSVVGTANATIAATALGLDEAVASFEVRSGGDQWAWRGRALAEPVAVRALDEGGRAVPGATVRFEPGAGSGRADPETAVTDSAGVASTHWTLGTDAGLQTLSVSAGGDTSLAVIATARNPDEAVSAVEAHSGEDQWAVAGHRLPEPVSVRVVDEDGQPVWGATVRFEPEAGTGNADPGTIATDSLGLASAVWTLGPELGVQRLGVTAGGATVAFDGTAVSTEGVCNRTPAVSAEIAKKARVGSCAEVTDEMLQGISRLDLSRKGIRRLRSGDFDRLPALRGVLLMVNQLEELPSDIFQGLPSLERLWLGVNPLGELPPRIFAGLTNLSDLALNTNGLVTLPPGVFDDLGSLEWLVLEDNAFESLRPDAFAGLSSLRVLNLKKNKLRELPPGLFKPTTRLEELYAVGNRFTHVPAGMFEGLSNLKRLDLSRSLIFDLSPRAFDGLVSLEELRLTGNQLDSLPRGLFAGLSSLEYARLHYNPGAPFPVHAGLVRADTSDLLAPAPARVRLRVPSGAPFAFRIPLLVQRGRASSRFLEVAVGDTVSQSVEVTSDGTRAVHVVLGVPPDPPAGFDALRLVSGLPMVLFAETDNRTPVNRSVIPDHRLQAGGPAADLVLAHYFDDPDGDSLVYEVASADPDVVRGSIAEGTLWLEPGAVDTTEIVVTATDPEGLRAVQRIRTWVVPAADPGAFNIELIFGPGFTEEARAEIRRAAERWMEVVVGDLPDVPVDGTGPEYCTNRAPTPRLVGTIDDLLIYLHMRLGDRDAIGSASRCMEREESGLAVIGANWFSGVFHPPSGTYTFYETALHEIGHIVGIGAWEIEDRYTDPHFPGPLAVAAFDAAGGAGYQGGKVPVEDLGAWGGGGRWGHWRSRVMPDDIMSIGGGMLITPITVQALADLGHVVDVTKADPYTLPGQAQRDAGGVAGDADAAVAELLADDLIRVPVEVVDEDGKVVRIIRP